MIRTGNSFVVLPRKPALRFDKKVNLAKHIDISRSSSVGGSTPLKRKVAARRYLLASQPFARDTLRQLQRLTLEQPAIDPALALDKASMGAFLGDVPMFEDLKSVESAHRRQSVSDNECCAARHCRNFLTWSQMWLSLAVVMQRVQQIAEMRIGLLFGFDPFGSCERLQFHPMSPMLMKRI